MGKKNNGSACVLPDIMDFTICKESGHIVFSPIVNDSIPTDLIFDTGTTDCLILKKSFANKLGSAKASEHFGFKSGFHNGLFSADFVKDSINISTPNTIIKFDSYYVVDDNSPLGRTIGCSDGIFPISAGLSNVTISFSNKTLQFNTKGNTQVQEYDFSSSLVKYNDNQYAISSFPICVLNNDSILWLKDLIVDTGYRGDIWVSGTLIDSLHYSLVFKDDSDLAYDILNRDKSTTRLRYMHDDGLIGRYFWIEHRQSHYRSVVDSLKTIIGTEFLKGFDIYMDFVRDSIWLRKNKYISILDEPDDEAGPLIAGRTDSKGRFYVMYMRYASLYTIAGLKPGDIITTINSRPFSDYRDSIRFGLLSHKQLEIAIIRDHKDTMLVFSPNIDKPSLE